MALAVESVVPSSAPPAAPCSPNRAAVSGAAARSELCLHVRERPSTARAPRQCLRSSSASFARRCLWQFSGPVMASCLGPVARVRGRATLAPAKASRTLPASVHRRWRPSMVAAVVQRVPDSEAVSVDAMRTPSAHGVTDPQRSFSRGTPPRIGARTSWRSAADAAPSSRRPRSRARVGQRRAPGRTASNASSRGRLVRTSTIGGEPRSRALGHARGRCTAAAVERPGWGTSTGQRRQRLTRHADRDRDAARCCARAWRADLGRPTHELIARRAGAAGAGSGRARRRQLVTTEPPPCSCAA